MLTHWWLNELPPVPGLLRLVFYTGLLTLCLFDHPSPLDAPKLVAGSEPLFATPPKALRALGLDWLGPRTLRIIRTLTIIAWVCAAAGLLQPVTGVLTFLGVAALHGSNAGLLGSNHSTHSALYALFCMAFSVSYDGPTLDRLLATHTHWPLLVDQGSVFQSGFGPTLLLIGLTYIMFAGGVSKVLNGGAAWFSGRGLKYYIEQSADYARSPSVVRALTSRPRLCAALATLSVVVEISAPLAVFVHGPYRLLFVLSWCALHVGILLVMMPAYYVQMWCYTLVLNWYQIAGLILRRQLVLPDAPDTSGAAAQACAAFGFAFTAVLILVLLRQIEQWPFTSVPMYSNGEPPENLAPPAPGRLHELAVRAAGGRAAAWHRPWVSTEVQQEIQLVPRDGGAPVPLYEAMGETDARFVRWSQYAKVVRGVAVADLAAKPADGYALTGPGYPAGRFLARAAELVRSALPDWDRFERLDLVCNTAQGWIATGSAPLDPDAITAEQAAAPTTSTGSDS